jgi:hypothetical protein
MTDGVQYDIADPALAELGRQRIAWGTGRFFSPLDLLNPVSPVSIEREERLGVDAALLEARFGPLSRLSLVAAPRRNGSPSRALQWHGNAAGIDHSFVAGRLLGQDVVGADIAGRIGTSGLRGEAAHFKPVQPAGASYWRSMLGADHGFANSLTVSLEIYRNGGGVRDRARYDFAALTSGRTLALATRYIGVFASYDVTPLLKWTTQAIVNADDRSRALDMRLAWSVRADLELAAGVQRLSGSPGSEYGQLPGSVFVQLQGFF